MSARAFVSWCAAISDRLRTEGWDNVTADETAPAVVSVIEGALVLSRTCGDARALGAAKAAAESLLRGPGPTMILGITTRSQ